MLFLFGETLEICLSSFLSNFLPFALFFEQRLYIADCQVKNKVICSPVLANVLYCW